MINFGEYSVKNLKTFMGTDGYGYNCTLYKGTKKVALCINDGGGGQVEVSFYDINDIVDYTFPNENDGGKPYTMRMTREHRAFEQYLSTLPNVPSEYFPDGLKMDEELFIGELVSQVGLEKDFKKVYSKHHIIKTNDCQKGEYLRCPKKNKQGTPYSMVSILKHLDEKFGIGNYQIIETFDQFQEQVIGNE